MWLLLLVPNCNNSTSLLLKNRQKVLWSWLTELLATLVEHAFQCKVAHRVTRIPNPLSCIGKFELGFFFLLYPSIRKLWQTLIWLNIERCFIVLFVKQRHEFQHCLKISYFVQGNLIQAGCILHSHLQIFKPDLPVMPSSLHGLHILNFSAWWDVLY